MSWKVFVSSEKKKKNHETKSAPHSRTSWGLTRTRISVEAAWLKSVLGFGARLRWRRQCDTQATPLSATRPKNQAHWTAFTCCERGAALGSNLCAVCGNTRKYTGESISCKLWSRIPWELRFQFVTNVPASAAGVDSYRQASSDNVSIIPMFLGRGEHFWLSFVDRKIRGFFFSSNFFQTPWWCREITGIVSIFHRSWTETKLFLFGSRNNYFSKCIFGFVFEAQEMYLFLTSCVFSLGCCFITWMGDVVSSFSDKQKSVIYLREKETVLVGASWPCISLGTNWDMSDFVSQKGIVLFICCVAVLIMDGSSEKGKTKHGGYDLSDPKVMEKLTASECMVCKLLEGKGNAVWEDDEVFFMQAVVFKGICNFVSLKWRIAIPPRKGCNASNISGE